MSCTCCTQGMSEYDYDVVDFMVRDLADSLCDCVHSLGYQRLYDFDVRFAHHDVYSCTMFVDLYVYVPENIKSKIRSAIANCASRHEFSLNTLTENSDTFDIHVTASVVNNKETRL